MTAWLADAGLTVLQLLPLNEMAPGQQSPYSAISAMAIDPIYIRVTAVPDFIAIGGEASLGADDRELLAAVRHAPRVDYANVRTLKHRAFRAAFDRFLEAEWRRRYRSRARVQALRHRAGVVGGGLRALSRHSRAAGRAAVDGMARRAAAARAGRDRSRAARALARSRCSTSTCSGWRGTQWQERARRAAAASRSSATCRSWWTATARTSGRASRISASMPRSACRPTRSARRGRTGACRSTAGTRSRPRTSGGCASGRGAAADLYDGYRVDHLVGFYRTYGRPRDGGEPFFTPADEPTQIALGERVLDIFREAGRARSSPRISGPCPTSSARRWRGSACPASACFRWERQWHDAGTAVPRSAGVPAAVGRDIGHARHRTAGRVVGAATPRTSAQQINELPIGAAADAGRRACSDAPFDPAVRDVLLEALFASGSNLLLLPVQDVFGWRDRINEPATVNEDNWTFRLPWPSDRLDEIPEARERQDTLRRWAAEYDSLRDASSVAGLTPDTARA